MSVFASEPMSLEPKQEEPQPPQQNAQPASQPQLPSDVSELLSILGEGDLNTFTTRYINLIQQDNNNLISYLNDKFKSNDKTVFEFIYNLFKSNSNEEWSIQTFYVTIMNLGLTIKDQGIPNFYYYMLLTDQEHHESSPIYGLVQSFGNGYPEDINKNFIQRWNSLFKKEEFSVEPGKTFKLKLPSNLPSNLSKNARYSIILTVVFLFIILGVCGAYFFTKYGGTTDGIVSPKIIKQMSTITPPTVPSLNIGDF